MRFAAVSLLALSGFAAALSRRDLATLQADFNNLGTQVTKLGSDLAAYQGGYVVALVSDRTNCSVCSGQG